MPYYIERTDDKGNIVRVNEEKKQLIGYSNKKGEAWYFVQTDFELLKGSGIYWHSKIRIEKQVDRISERLEVLNNPIKRSYLEAIGMDERNDPEKTLWQEYVRYATDHADKFFDEVGDWLDSIELDGQSLLIEVLEL